MIKPAENISFNLVDEAWIPVQRLDGSLAELGLRDLFAQAHLLRRMSNEVPTLDFAILRVLLAVARQAVGAVEEPLDEWTSLWEQESFPAETVEAYLDRNEIHNRFDLLGARAPFMQTPTLETPKNEYDSPGRLIPDIPAGHQHFTTRAGSGAATLSFAEAARWLVHLQAYDYSGIKPGALGDDRVKGGKGYPIGTGWAGRLGGLYVEGANLFETLMLNLRFAELGTGEDQDTAIWEREVPDASSTRGDGSVPKKGSTTPPDPVGDSDIFTWPSRRVRLRHDATHITAALVTNGDRLLPQNSHIFEPLSLWRDSVPQAKKLGVPVFMPREHDPSRAAWRGLGAILGSENSEQVEGRRHETPRVLRQLGRLIHKGTIDDDYSFSTVLVGFRYGPQDSSFEAQYDDKLTFMASLLTEKAVAHRQEALAAASRTGYAIRDLGDLAKNLLIAGGNDRPADPAGVLAAAYFDFDHEFRSWLSKVAPDNSTNDIRAGWNQRARTLLTKHADRLMSRASERSLLGSQDKDGHWNTAHTARARFNASLRKRFPSDSDVPPNSPPPAKEKANV
ncbi:type I-E CRISPR-associated protein Cse1/CasA [Arthrobacter sp. MYb227]|uniref:type I-E CRISPR-associated protein Cse1/CasA n=1 Tax=Arthrobacter sp. MYb227 TaxID=1848601 RepID=UPI000CFC2A78|nr:type I-E CRISPR-associated protein Cse1/CasA [Arthrobacter sp. MYb227]PQZ94896.1 type I-E CRISPR-associated protein Cse1/CasA [Arthrobacter sp. MYb227]